MLTDFNGKVAVVTGAASGIGRALAVRLAAQGAHVVAADIDGTGAHATAESARSHGVEALGLSVDVSDRASVDALADAAFERFGAVDLLCNNAGVVRMLPLSDYTDQDWAWMVGVNLFGVVHGLQAFLPRMRARGSGHILNTASAAGLVPQLAKNLTPYTATKYAIVGLSENLARELEPDGIGVTVLCPRTVSSGMLHGSEARRPARFGGSGAPPPAADEVPQTRGMDPADVARLALDAVLRRDLYVLTHAEIEPMVEERIAALRAAFDAQRDLT